jgi:hypothetical protein
MTFPRDIPIIDTFLGIPRAEQTRVYDFLRPMLKDTDSKERYAFPAEYMFKGVPKVGAMDDYVAYTLGLMDRFGIRTALLGYDPQDPNTERALAEHPDRFIAEYFVDPNRGMESVRDIERLARTINLGAVSAFPAGMTPQVSLGDKRFYPVYAKCIELAIPVFACVGVPGPRVPMAPQHANEIDELCCFFPELVLVLRHGAEPWVDLAVELMRRHENLFYSTSAFAPKHYPQAFIDYANADGAHKVLYAGYFPAGLTLDRIFAELPNVPFEDHVWPKFLNENASRILRLPERARRAA